MDGQEAGHHVDDRAGHEERRNAPRPLFEQRLAVVLDVGQAADAGAHDHADALSVGIGDFQSGMSHCLEAGGQAVLNEQIELARFLGGQVLLDIETLHRAAEAGGEGGNVHVLKRTDAAAASQNTFPAARHIGTQRRKHTHPGDHDTSTRHCFVLLFTNGKAAAIRSAILPTTGREV